MENEGFPITDDVCLTGNFLYFGLADCQLSKGLTLYRLSMIPPKSSYERLIAGGLAGAISRTCVAPFERLRTIMMTETSTNMAQAIRRVYNGDGILGVLSHLLRLPESEMRI